jgi:hypothetical protein
MTVAKSPLNAWLDELLQLVEADGGHLLPSTIRKIKKGGMWQRVSPKQYFDAGKANYERMMKEQKLKEEGATP